MHTYTVAYLVAWTNRLDGWLTCPLIESAQPINSYTIISYLGVRAHFWLDVRLLFINTFNLQHMHAFIYVFNVIDFTKRLLKTCSLYRVCIKISPFAVKSFVKSLLQNVMQFRPHMCVHFWVTCHRWMWLKSTFWFDSFITKAASSRHLILFSAFLFDRPDIFCQCLI